MGKLRRGLLWVALPPAGAAASYRAGKRKDTDRIVAAINGTPKLSRLDRAQNDAAARHAKKIARQAQVADQARVR